MKQIVGCVSVLLTLLSYCHSLNILGIFPYQGKSHFFVFSVYLQELARRGHNVTVISHFPEKSQIANYHDISLAGSVKILEDEAPFERNILMTLATAYILSKFALENCEVLLQNKDVQELWNKENIFDVIVVEQFNSDCALGLAHKIGAPVVGLTSHILMPWHYNRFGIPFNPSYVSFHFTEGGTKPTLYQRIRNSVLDVYFNAIYKHVVQRGNQNTLAKYFDDTPPLEELAREMKFLLLYTNFVVMGPRLFPPNVIEVGGYHVAKPKTLSTELKKYIDEAENGVIYISFGSLVKSSAISKDRIDAIIAAISAMPQRFIWKFDDTTVAEKYKNLYVSSWLPQNDILAHPNTVAFYSHCGNLGTTEAIHHGVPMVAMPVLGDQPSNAAAVEESGLGVQIQISELTKENLVAAFNKVLNPKFREHVKKLSLAWHDRPRSPIDTAIYWTEFAAKHKNITYRTASADVPLYQYLCLDIAGFFAILGLLSLVIIKKILSRCCSTKLKNDCSIGGKNTKSKKKSKKE